jgi:hypothetical protein
MKIEIRKHKESSIMDLFIDNKYQATFFYPEEFEKWKKNHGIL